MSLTSPRSGRFVVTITRLLRHLAFELQARPTACIGGGICEATTAEAVSDNFLTAIRARHPGTLGWNCASERDREFRSEFVAHAVKLQGSQSAGCRTQSQDHSVDRATGVHIYSIYGDTTASWHPPESVLRKLDVLVIDIQDIGSRFYTYEFTLGYALESAAITGTEVFFPQTRRSTW